MISNLLFTGLASRASNGNSCSFRRPRGFVCIEGLLGTFTRLGVRERHDEASRGSSQFHRAGLLSHAHEGYDRVTVHDGGNFRLPSKYWNAGMDGMLRAQIV